MTRNAGSIGSCKCLERADFKGRTFLATPKPLWRRHTNHCSYAEREALEDGVAIHRVGTRKLLRVPQRGHHRGRRPDDGRSDGAMSAKCPSQNGADIEKLGGAANMSAVLSAQKVTIRPWNLPRPLRTTTAFSSRPADGSDRRREPRSTMAVAVRRSRPTDLGLHRASRPDRPERQAIPRHLPRPISRRRRPGTIEVVQTSPRRQTLGINPRPPASPKANGSTRTSPGSPSPTGCRNGNSPCTISAPDTPTQRRSCTQLPAATVRLAFDARAEAEATTTIAVIREALRKFLDVA